MEYISIPIIAALVGYVTNYVGVNMLFYPIKWRGIPIKRWLNQPYGLVGWQGIVPAKRIKMAGNIVDVTLSQLLTISEVFGRLEPHRIADALAGSVRGVVFGGLMPQAVVRVYLKVRVLSVCSLGLLPIYCCLP